MDDFPHVRFSESFSIHGVQLLEREFSVRLDVKGFDDVQIRSVSSSSFMVNECGNLLSFDRSLGCLNHANFFMFNELVNF